MNEFWRITVRKIELALSCVFWCTRILVFAVVAISTAWGRLCWRLDSWNTSWWIITSVGDHIPNESSRAIFHETLSEFTALNEFWRITVRKMELALSSVFWCTRIVVFAVVVITAVWRRLCRKLDSWNTGWWIITKCWQPHPKWVLPSNSFTKHCPCSLHWTNFWRITVRKMELALSSVFWCTRIVLVAVVVITVAWRRLRWRLDSWNTGWWIITSVGNHIPNESSRGNLSRNIVRVRSLHWTNFEGSLWGKWNLPWAAFSGCTRIVLVAVVVITVALKEVALEAGQLEHRLMDNYKCWQPHPKRVQQGQFFHETLSVFARCIETNFEGSLWGKWNLPWSAFFSVHQWRRQPKKWGGPNNFSLLMSSKKLQYTYMGPPPPPIYKTLLNGFAQISGGSEQKWGVRTHPFPPWRRHWCTRIVVVAVVVITVAWRRLRWRLDSWNTSWWIITSVGNHIPNESRSAIFHETLSVFAALNEFWRITVRKMELALISVF